MGEWPVCTMFGMIVVMGEVMFGFFSIYVRSHYDRATTRAPKGKAPGPDAITNELIKHLPEAAHTLLYTLF